MFKQCPNPKCKLIWAKINGCYNTHCGNKPDYLDYIKGKVLFRYQVKVQNDKITYHKN